MRRYGYLLCALLLWACAALCLIAFLTACSSCAPGLMSRGGVERLMPASARVRVLCDGQLRGYGSGVAVGPRHLVTAKHVVQACKTTPTPDMAQYQVVLDDGSRREAVLVREAEGDVDVALLVLGGAASFRTWAELADYRPLPGQRVWLYTGDGRMDQKGEWAFHLKEGIVTRVHGDVLVVSAHVVPGNSGAAAFDDDGRVVGILVGGRWDSSEEFYLEAWRPRAWRALVPLELEWTH